MKNAELIQEIRGQVARLRAGGQQVLAIDLLDGYLAQLETMTSTEPNQLDQVTLQRVRSQLDIQLAEHKRIGDQGLEAYRADVKAGQAAMQSTVLLNGGASVALLAFLGHLAGSSPEHALASASARPLLFFVAGVLAGTIAFGTTYLAQSSWNHGKVKRGDRWNAVSICLVVISYAFFGLGAWNAYTILNSLR